MTQKQAEKLKAQARKRYENTIAKAKQDLDRDLDAINRVVELTDAPSHASTGRRNGRLYEKVSETVDHLSTPFTVQELIDNMQEREDLNGSLNGGSVGNILKRLVDERRITVQTQGRGRAPTVYRKVPTGT